MGFSRGSIIEAEDALTGETVPIEADTLRLTLEAELYRLLKIGPKAELDGPYLDPDPRHSRPAQ